MTDPSCSACGSVLPHAAKFCPECGATVAAPAPERRKPATLLFCDMSGSTALGERVDAESVRELMFRYFHTMREAIERHGGTVEKFIGDAVVAVFGVPVAREDDALRAVRAAWEMQQRLAELNVELEARVGVTIALRIGLNTGEVVAGDSSSRQTIVTGDAVNTAARLEQAAKPGEVLLGEPTWRLVRAAVRAEAAGSIEAKGKSQPVPVYRLLEVTAVTGQLRRHPDTELVGREAELGSLLATWEKVETTGSCALVTLVGEPGIGKSRLSRELAARVGDGRILSGRCLSYGEGITWWPIAEIVREAVGIRDEDGVEDALARIDHAVGGETDGGAVRAGLAHAIGLEDSGVSTAEIGLAFRRLLHRVARERRVLVVVDDIQWAENAVLELLETLPAQLHSDPVLCVCLARPELSQRRPEWPGVVLEPLAGDDAVAHVGRLIADAGLSAARTAAVTHTAAGNPFFAEELVAMLAEDPDATMPASLSSLLAERLDRLGADERRGLECGAVEGEIFHRGAAEALAQQSLDGELERLCERAFLRRARASFADEAAFRFRHLLVRDATYNATAKRTRAELHERFADWLEKTAGERVTELEEIVGYHLEQAYLYRSELGPSDRPELAMRASERLAAAGRRAAGRRDVGAAASLLERAVALRDEGDATRDELLLELSIELLKGGRDMSGAHLGALEAGDDARLAALAKLERVYTDFQSGRTQTTELLAVASEAAEVLRATGDKRWEAHAHARAMVALVQQDRLAEAVTAGKQAYELARGTASPAVESEILEWLLLALAAGPTPVGEVESIMLEVVARPDFGPAQEWLTLNTLALARGPRGELDEGRALISRAEAIATDLGLEVNAACTAMQLAQIELLAHDVRDSPAELGRAQDVLRPQEAWNQLASVLAYQSLVLCESGHFAEARAAVAEAERIAASDDYEVRVMALGVARARILSAEGAHDEAIAAARDALPADREGQVFLATVAYEALGDVLVNAGRIAEARDAFVRALELHDEKGFSVAAGHVRKRLSELSAVPS